MYRMIDIRGEYPREVNVPFTIFLAQKFAAALGAKKLPRRIILAFDRRSGSRILAAAFSLAFPGQVKNLGHVPTPVLYHHVLRAHRAGVMITASHLNKHYNGFKLLLPNSQFWLPPGKLPVFTPRLQRATVPPIEVPAAEPVLLAYLKTLRRFVRLRKPVRISFVSRGSLNEQLVRLLPKVFPAVHIVTRGAAWLVASDPDGDRIELTYRGQKLSPETVFGLLLAGNRYRRIGALPVVETYLGQAFPSCRFFRLRTGHRFVTEAGRRNRLDFALERSGHAYFFRELGTEAPLLVLLKLLEFAEHHDLRRFIALQPFSVWNFNLPLKGQNVVAATRNLAERFRRRFSVTIERFDGAILTLHLPRVKGAIVSIPQQPIGMIHLRRSNAEETLRVLVAASDAHHLRLLKRELTKWRKKNS